MLNTARLGKYACAATGASLLLTLLRQPIGWRGVSDALSITAVVLLILAAGQMVRALGLFDSSAYGAKLLFKLVTNAQEPQASQDAGGYHAYRAGRRRGGGQRELAVVAVVFLLLAGLTG